MLPKAAMTSFLATSLTSSILAKPTLETRAIIAGLCVDFPGGSETGCRVTVGGTTTLYQCNYGSVSEEFTFVNDVQQQTNVQSQCIDSDGKPSGKPCTYNTNNQEADCASQDKKI
jgi:hypothetical protein